MARVSFDVSKKWLISILAALLVVTGIFFALNHLSNKNPLPPSIKSAVGYKVIYPSKTAQIDNSSYKYQPSDKILTFKVNKDSKTVVFTEQATPSELGSQTQAYYPALGIHPYAQFNTKLGTVALTKFYQSGNLKPAGQAAVLASNGTLLIANSQATLTNAQWKELFESLKITK